MLDRAEAERVVEAPKDANLVDVAWHTTTLPGTDIVLRKALMFTVTVDPPPAVEHLLVEGT